VRTASPQLSGVPSLMKRTVLVQPELVGGLGARAASGWPNQLKMMQAGPTHSGGNAAAEARGWPDFRAGGGRPSHLAVALLAARL
jgi:hypothetical protein